MPIEDLLLQFQNPRPTGNAVGDLFAQMQKKKNWDKAARAIYDATTPDESADGAVAPHPLGDKDAFNALSRDERIAKAQNLIEGNIIKDFQRRQGNADLEARRLGLVISGLEKANKEEADASAQLPDLLKLLTEQPGPSPYAGIPNATPSRRSVLGVAPTSAPGTSMQDRILSAIKAYPAAAKSMGLPARAVEAITAQDTSPIEKKYGNRTFLVNRRTGAIEGESTPRVAPQIPAGFVPSGITQDENGSLKFTFKPESEGKSLSQQEVGQIAALTQAENDLNLLERTYEQLGADYGGPVSGRIKNAFGAGQNEHINALQNAITAATPNLARGVFREVGVLTDADVDRYKALLPGPYDTDSVRKTKIKQLRERIATGKKELMGSLKSAGRDVQGFDTKPAAQRFQDEAAARSAGAKNGDVIELYDPQTATYRKAKLK